VEELPPGQTSLVRRALQSLPGPRRRGQASTSPPSQASQGIDGPAGGGMDASPWGSASAYSPRSLPTTSSTPAGASEAWMDPAPSQWAWDLRQPPSLAPGMSWRPSAGSQTLGNAAGAGSQAGSGRSRLLPLYRQTMLRLRSWGQPGAAGGAGGVGWDQEAALPEPGLEAACPTAAPGASGGGRGGSREVGIRVRQRYHPMVTPSGCISRHRISPQAAAELCTGVPLGLQGGTYLLNTVQ
jgi:hypothetical protein